MGDATTAIDPARIENRPIRKLLFDTWHRTPIFRLLCTSLLSLTATVIAIHLLRLTLLCLQSRLIPSIPFVFWAHYSPLQWEPLRNAFSQRFITPSTAAAGLALIAAVAIWMVSWIHSSLPVTETLKTCPTLSGVVGALLSVMCPTWSPGLGVAVPAVAVGIFLFHNYRAASRGDIRDHRTASGAGQDPNRRIPLFDGGPSDPTEDWARARTASTIGTLRRLVVDDAYPLVALSAPFGEGKSFLLDRFEDVLAHRVDPTPIVVRFTAWLPKDDLALVGQLLDSIGSAVHKRYLLPRFTKRLRDLSRVLLASVAHAPANIGRLIADQSQSQEIQQFHRTLARVPCPIIVLIDEIDRMHRSELEALFKILRGIQPLAAVSGRPSNLRFVCALDVGSVAHILGEGKDRAHWDRYIEKFFPVRVPLPKFDPERLTDKVLSHILSLGQHLPPASTDSQPRWNNFHVHVQSERKLLGQVFTNPRRVKRILASFESALFNLPHDIDPMDLLLISLV